MHNYGDMPKLELVGVAEVADTLGVHRSTVTRMVQAGKLEPTVRGSGPKGVMFFDPADVAVIVEQLGRDVA